MTIDQIAAQTAESILGDTVDDTDKRITAACIKAAIEKAVAPIEKALLETQVKAAAIQRELDECEQKLDSEMARHQSLQQFTARLRENQAFDRAAREVWKKQLEIATELFKKKL